MVEADQRPWQVLFMGTYDCGFYIFGVETDAVKGYSAENLNIVVYSL